MKKLSRKEKKSTPITTRGMIESEMDQIAGYIERVLTAPEDTAVIDMVRKEVERLCEKFPLYPNQEA